VDLLLGKKIIVPTVDGANHEFKISPNLDLKQPYRIAGKGMPHFNSHGRGDLLVDFIIKAPRELDAKARKALEELS
jgi:molecular chaperone DnaJ